MILLGLSSLIPADKSNYSIFYKIYLVLKRLSKNNPRWNSRDDPLVNEFLNLSSDDDNSDSDQYKS